jgi:hypothetical protein
MWTVNAYKGRRPVRRPKRRWIEVVEDFKKILGIRKLKRGTVDGHG